MDGFLWELPPVTSLTVDQQFEFVLIDTGQPFHREADPSDFEHQLNALSGEDEIAVFDNLGGDAVMIVPAPVEGADYRDMLHFLRTAEQSHVHRLWKTLSVVVSQKLSNDPIWISVSGAGVAWLHVRLDSQPKYYEFGRYRDFPRG